MYLRAVCWFTSCSLSLLILIFSFFSLQGSLPNSSNLCILEARQPPSLLWFHLQTFTVSKPSSRPSCSPSSSCPSWGRHTLFSSRLSYRQLFVGDDEQIGVGSLHFNTGGQFNALIGGLAQHRTEHKHRLSTASRTQRAVISSLEVDLPRWRFHSRFLFWPSRSSRSSPWCLSRCSL